MSEECEKCKLEKDESFVVKVVLLSACTLAVSFKFAYWSGLT